MQTYINFWQRYWCWGVETGTEMDGKGLLVWDSTIKCILLPTEKAETKSVYQVDMGYFGRMTSYGFCVFFFLILVWSNCLDFSAMKYKPADSCFYERGGQIPR